MDHPATVVEEDELGLQLRQMRLKPMAMLTTNLLKTATGQSFPIPTVK